MVYLLLKRKHNTLQRKQTLTSTTTVTATTQQTGTNNVFSNRNETSQHNLEFEKTNSNRNKDDVHTDIVLLCFNEDS